MGRGLLLWLIGIPLPIIIFDLVVRRFALDRDQPEDFFRVPKSAIWRSAVSGIALIVPAPAV
jgi:hypothetical protein